MTDTFKDGIEAALREALRTATARCQMFLDTFGDVGDCVTQADINDWHDVIDAPEQSTALTLSPLTESFHQFKLAYISAGGARNPKTPDAKGWRPAELVFMRLVRKDKHDPQAIITGTQAYAEYMRKVIARDPSKIAYVPAPKPFLNGEQFMQAWDRANPTTPSGSQRGAPSMFDVAENLSGRS